MKFSGSLMHLLQMLKGYLLHLCETTRGEAEHQYLTHQELDQACILFNEGTNYLKFIKVKLYQKAPHRKIKYHQIF